MKENYKRLWSLLVVLSFAFSVIPSGNIRAAEGSETREKAQKSIFLVQTQSKGQAVQLEQKYEEADTISSLSEESMQKHAFTALELTEEQAKALEKRDSVELVEPDVEVQGCTIHYEDKKVKKIKSRKAGKNTKWNLQAIHTELNKRKSNRKNKVKVALLDSGVDLFNDIEVKESINLIPGEEEVLPLFWDTSGHGTSIAGVMAAQDNEEGITGINPDIELYSARVLDEDKTAPVSRIVEALYWAMERDVDIISISFGTARYSEALETAIQAAYKKGILIVAAAGNHEKVEYPAAFPEVVAVGGTDASGAVCDYSARGKEVELVAPSEQICATGSFDGTVICNGTSMAVPHVVGVAAKLWEKDRTVSADFIRQLMNASANRYGDEQEYGNGLVDYGQAVKVYDKFAANYEPGNTVEENKQTVGENPSPVEQFTDVDYVNGTWETPEHQECVTVATKGKGIAQATIEAMKKGAIYPDKPESTVKGMGAYPYMHGYFKYDSNDAKNNYILSYVDLAKEADKIRRGKETYKSISLCYVPKADTFYKTLNKKWSQYSCKNNAQKGAFAWGIAIHSATDVFAHSVYGYWDGKWQRFFHDDLKYGNKYADNPKKAPQRLKAAKAVSKNIIAHYIKGEQGKPGDFYCDKYDVGCFKLYYLKTYMEQAGDSATAKKIKIYSKGD